MRILQADEEFRKSSLGRIFRRLRVLFRCREIEHDISLYQGFLRLVVEQQLLVRVRGNIFVLEFGVEFGINCQTTHVRLCKFVVEFRAVGEFGGGAFLADSLRADEFGGGEGFGPFGYEDVVLEVEGDEVGDVVPEGFEMRADVCGQGYWGEDC